MSVPVRIRVLRLIARWIAAKAPASRLVLATWLAPLATRLASKRVRVARTNLGLCFPELTERQRSELLRRSLVANVKGLLDACVAWYSPALSIDRHYVVTGQEHLQDAIRQGRGVVILGGHYHGSEMHMRAVAILAGRAAAPMVRAFRDPAIDLEINGCRRHFLGGVIERDDVRALCATVRAGGVAIYTPDVNVRTRNLFVPFFRIEASTLAVLPTILGRAGGVIVPTWVCPLEDGRYRLMFEAPWPDFPGGDARAAAAHFNGWVEARVRQSPEAYDWGVKRFKTRPAGEAGVY